MLSHCLSNEFRIQIHAPAQWYIFLTDTINLESNECDDNDDMDYSNDDIGDMVDLDSEDIANADLLDEYYDVDDTNDDVDYGEENCPDSSSNDDKDDKVSDSDYDSDDSVDSKQPSTLQATTDSKLVLLARWFVIVFFRIQHSFSISNKAANAILSLFSALLTIVSHPLRLVLPSSYKSAIGSMDLNYNADKQLFAVCPNESCNALYELSVCTKSSVCNSTSYGRVCGKVLGFERHLSRGLKTWTPFKFFHFIPPSAWLKKMFDSTEFRSILEENDFSTGRTKYLNDIYSGRIWKEFSQQGFFSSKYNLGLMLNVDWFKPFKRSEYKVAALMVTFLNLPRAKRFLKKWTIIAGKPVGTFQTNSYK
ncbi:hypothetical protein SPONL_2133 [uncultured Candidatus Thioglobus sp.]|nr:hypothetical protein SPONL_2133 [uncultured Candidatus Thioglobus sp.]